MSDNNFVKVFFVQKINEEEFEIESLCCEKFGDHFLIDNIPFVAKNVSSGDIIKATFDEEEKRYYFDDFIENSGKSTIRVYILDKSKREELEKYILENNCEYEGFEQRNIIAINVLKEVDYKPLKNYLDIGESRQFWSYEESCLEHIY